MAPDTAVLTRLARLRKEMHADLEALAARHGEVAALLSRLESGEGLPRSDLIVTAVNLHAYYTALETLLERVARHLDDEVPQGPDWHRELVAQMRVEVPGLRPAVVPDECGADLDELRKFRHFFRNAYVLDLDAEKIRAHAHRLCRVQPALATGLDRLQRHVDGLIAALVGS